MKRFLFLSITGLLLSLVILGGITLASSFAGCTLSAKAVLNLFILSYVCSYILLIKFTWSSLKHIKE